MSHNFAGDQKISQETPAATPDHADSAFATVLLGRRVIEVSGGLAGEHCGHALAGFGAEVLLVRPPTPEPSVGVSHPLDQRKRIVELDPWTDEGFEALVRLTLDCDVFIEDRPPLGWPGGHPLSPRLVQRNPQLLAICLSPFGLTGPYANYAAYPLNSYHAGGNAQQIPCDPLRPEDSTRSPLQAGGQWGEAQAGTLAAIATLADLLDGEHHAGKTIDCSKQEALISFNWTEVARYINEGRSPTRLAPLATIVGGVLPTQDGFVQVAVREDHQWAALARLLERPEWAEDPLLSSRAARSSRWREVANLLAVATRQFTTRQLHLSGRELGIPIAAVLSLPELLADADLAARSAWEDIGAAGGTSMKLPRWDASVSPSATAVTPDAAMKRTQATGRSRQAGRPGAPGKPLQGLRVLDLGWVAMGPYAGYLLAGLGAEVIHIGRPDKGRLAGLELSSYNYGFDALNTGKTWVGIDLQRPEGVDLIRELATRCDIVLENFRPGVTERLGIGFSALSALNPQLVMLSASTYGRRNIGGPYVGYAPVFSALAGLAHLTGYADGPPAEVSHPVDFFAGSVGVLGILAGLHRRAVTGTGCHIDLSAREAILWSLSNDIALYQAGHHDGQRLGNSHSNMAPHGVYRCRGENRWISIAVGSDAEWQRLCHCIGAAGLSADLRFLTVQHRIENRAQIDQLLEKWTQAQELGQLFQRLQASGIAAFPSSTSEDLCKDPHVKERGILLSRETGQGKRWYLAAPWCHQEQSRNRLETTQGNAAIRNVFADLLGLSQVQIEALQSDGVIAAR